MAADQTTDDTERAVDADAGADTAVETSVEPGSDTAVLDSAIDELDDVPDGGLVARRGDGGDLVGDDGGGDGDGDGELSGPTPTKRGLDKGLLAACFVIAGGIMLIAWGLITAQTGDEGVDRPEVIENLSPVENALQVLQQETIVIDFEFGFEAELILDGIALETTRIGELDFDGLEPGQQVQTPPTAVFDPGNSRLEFRPSPGAQIEELTEGTHTAQVIYWRIDEGRENARSYTWSFTVI